MFLLSPQEEGMNNVKEMMNQGHEEAHRRLKGVAEQLRIDCDVYLRIPLGVGAGSGKTKLDQFRLKSCTAYIVSGGIFMKWIRKKNGTDDWK